MVYTSPGEAQHAADVQTMFDRIARRYVLMNTLMTLGQDRLWRREVVRLAALPTGGRLLDIATGTGDIALEALRHDPALTVVGGDFAVEMMRVGQRRPGTERVLWAAADALALPFPDATFDAVTSGYLMRNLPPARLVDGLREQMRVLKPGGRLVALDTTPPPANLLRPFIIFHLRVVIPALGRLVSGNADAYQYLPSSTEAFKTPEELAVLMREAGLSEVRFARVMFGTMAIHVGRRQLWDLFDL